MMAIAKENGWKVKNSVTSFSTLIASLNTKKIDISNDAMFITPERKKQVNFSDSFYVLHDAIIVKKSETSVKTYDQLKGKPLSSPVRVAQIAPVRQIVEEELETVWDNKKPAKEALDNAVARGNAVLLAQAQLPAPEAKAGKTGKRHK